MNDRILSPDLRQSLSSDCAEKKQKFSLSLRDNVLYTSSNEFWSIIYRLSSADTEWSDNACSYSI